MQPAVLLNSPMMILPMLSVHICHRLDPSSLLHSSSTGGCDSAWSPGHYYCHLVSFWMSAFLFFGGVVNWGVICDCIVVSMKRRWLKGSYFRVETFQSSVN